MSCLTTHVLSVTKVCKNIQLWCSDFIVDKGIIRYRSGGGGRATHDFKVVMKFSIIIFSKK